MKRQMDKKDLIDELSKRTNFYKKYTKMFIDALEDILLENMLMATEDERSRVSLMGGALQIGGYWRPDKIVRDLRTGEDIFSKGRIIPYARLKQRMKYRQVFHPDDDEDAEMEDECEQRD